MRPLINLMGQRFGRLLVTAEAPRHRNGRTQWLCRCDCGSESLVMTFSLRNGGTTSCGCRARENSGTRTHGKSRTPEYRNWSAMISRCTNERGPDYHNYGGRGIAVCERWRHSFENFLADMGNRPTPQHTVERVNNDGDYGPDNCRWATPAQQAKNKRTNHYVEYRGARMTLTDAARTAGIIECATAFVRVKSGWSVERAVETPPLFRRDKNMRWIRA